MATPASFTTDQRRARIGRRHLLAPSTRVRRPVEVAEALVALHSSDPATVHLSAALRTREPTIAAVEDELYGHRSLVRFHAMRRTLWVATPELARTAHAATTRKLLGPERARLVRLLAEGGVGDDPEGWLEDAEERTLAALHAAGQATTRELGEAVPALRHPLDPAPGKPWSRPVAAHTRVLLLLGLHGLIVRTRPVGSWVSGQYRWASAQDWVDGGIDGDTLSEAEAAAELAGRWLQAFGPATEADLQWWAGWTKTTTRRALADAGAEEVDLGGTPGWVAGGDSGDDSGGHHDDTDATPEPWAALLPGLDPTTMGWKGREWYLSPEVEAAVFDRNGNAGPTVWVDGRIVGGWAQRPDGEVVAVLMEDIGSDARRLVDAEVERVSGLLAGTRVSWRFPPPRDLLAE